MAVTMLTPRGTHRWRSPAFQVGRRQIGLWLGVKAALVGLVLFGWMGVWTAFVVDTAVALAVVVHGWRLARRSIVAAKARAL